MKTDSRLNRKKSTQETNLRDVNDAKGHYEEALAHVLGKKPKTTYYTEENGKVIHDTISLDGDDWLFVQHQELDGLPTEDDFKAVIADYLSWKIGSLMKGGKSDV